MKKVLVIPHTHWDREWYFTSETSSVLLNTLKTDLLSKKFSRFTLDGQISLLEELLEDSTAVEKKQINKLILDNKLIIGPLYSQNDTFNTLAPTTQLNLDLASKVINDRQNNKTIYMPDSFGFNEQLPQIFKLNGYDNFVFWRGIRVEDINNCYLFVWKGIDGTKILSSTMTKGYYALGQHYPYNQEPKKNKEFKFELVKYVNNIKKNIDLECYFVPLGGDQAPLEFEIDNILEKLNNEQKEFHFITGSYQEYFDTLNKNKIDQNKLFELDYCLNYSGTSKIHRTIHSNRYDNKKLFRQCEKLLYYVLEPLEIMYSKYNGKVYSQEYKELHIYKPLVKTAAHDSIGGCVSDITNKLINSRLDGVKSAINSYIDLMLLKINENLKEKKSYVVYNVAPFSRDVTVFDKISTNSNKNFNINTEKYDILQYGFEDLSFKEHDPVFLQNLLIHVKNMKPFSYKVISLKDEEQSENNIICVKPKLMSNIKLDKNKIHLKINNDFIPIDFIIEESQGDEFDFSKPDNQEIANVKKIELICSTDNNQIEYNLFKLTFNYKNMIQTAEIAFWDIYNNFDIKIKLNNKLSDCRLSLLLPKDEILLSRHLAFINQKEETIKSWKNKSYKDNLVNSYGNDGLVKFNKMNFNLLTEGNNEVIIESNCIKLVLARFSEFLGKPNLNDRPGAASGVPMKVRTHDAQLHKELTFDLQINNLNPVLALNNWNYIPVGKQKDIYDLIYKPLDRFVTNTVQLDLTKQVEDIEINPEKILMSHLRIKNEKIEFMFSNPLSIKVGKHQPYKIVKGLGKLKEV